MPERTDQRRRGGRHRLRDEAVGHGPTRRPADPLHRDPQIRQGLGGRFRTGDVDLGYRATLALTGAGRIHWMLTRGTPPPDSYTDFIITETNSL